MSAEPVAWAVMCDGAARTVCLTETSARLLAENWREQNRGREFVFWVVPLYDRAALDAAVAAARAEERERCAAAIEPTNADRPDDWTEYAKVRAECAAAIRDLKPEGE